MSADHFSCVVASIVRLGDCLPALCGRRLSFALLGCARPVGPERPTRTRMERQDGLSGRSHDRPAQRSANLFDVSCTVAGGVYGGRFV